MNETAEITREELAEFTAATDKEKAALQYSGVINSFLQEARRLALLPGTRAGDWVLIFGALLIAYGKKTAGQEWETMIQEETDGSPEQTAAVIYKVISQHTALMIGRMKEEVTGRIAAAYYRRAFGEWYENRGFLTKPGAIAQALQESPIKRRESDFDENQLHDIREFLFEECEKAWINGYISGFGDCDRLTKQEEPGKKGGTA